jgi:hypothetical protein
MVTITIVLGAIIFVVAQSFSKSTAPQAPHIAFTKQASNLQVINVPEKPPIDWFSDMGITGSCVTSNHLQLAPLGGPAGAFPLAAGTVMNPGDQLVGCQPGDSLTVTHKASNTVIYTVNF